MLRRLAAPVALIASFLVAGASGASEPLNVTLDHAKVVRIDEPAATIIIGNPLIADATMTDASTVVITGKSFGETNLLMLDDAGNVIADRPLWVRGPNTTTVTIYRQGRRFTASCTPVCEEHLKIGDDKDHIEALQTQIQTRNALSQAYANSESQ